VVAPEVHIEPAHNDGHSCIRAHGYEKKRGVLQGAVVVHRDEYCEASDADADREYGEKEAVFQTIRKPRNQHAKPKGCGPGRHAVELCLDGTVAVALNDGGGEICVSVGGHDEAEVHEAADEDLEVFEYVTHVAEFDGAFAGGAALVDAEAGLDEDALFFGEPFDFLGKVGQEEEECEGYQDCQ
jgi:hypothetical protein